MSPRLPLIWNVRRGFATNSSSSHSMLLLDRPADQVLSFVDSAGNYGWNAFTLVERAAKEDSAADREHLAMASGMPVDQFLSLPFVRPCIKKQVEDQQAAGSTPSSVEGEWIMVDGAPHWRVNRLWRYLIAVSEARAPQVWDHYVKGEMLGV